jgi:hypothetical protein
VLRQGPDIGLAGQWWQAGDPVPDLGHGLASGLVQCVPVALVVWVDAQLEVASQVHQQVDQPDGAARWPLGGS